MGLRNWKGPKQENAKPGVPGTSYVSRKQQRKTAKRIKKLQHIAYAKRQNIETVMEEAFNKGKNKKAKKGAKPKPEPVAVLPVTRPDTKEVNVMAESSSDDDAKYPYEREGKKKRKRGLKRKNDSDDSDSDDGVTYQQYLKEVTAKKEEIKIMNSEGAEEDNHTISRYAKLLRLNRDSKSLPKKFEEDGLDYLLDFCDTEKRKQIVNSEEHDVDLKGDDLESDGSLSEEYDDGGLDLSEGQGASHEEGSGDEMDEEMDDEEMESDVDDEGNASDGEEEDDEPAVVEDIYGRKIDKRSGELIKFDPAGARKRLEELDSKGGDDQSRLNIDKTITGIINRLSEATVVKSRQTVTELWQNNSKNDVKNSLAKVVWRLLGAPYRLQDSLLSSYAMFLGLINAGIGSEISAHLVEVFLVDYVKLITQEKEQDNKALENRTVFIAHLLNFRIIKPSVIIEVLRKLRANFNIDNLQLIYTLCVYSWKQMRRQSWLEFSEQVTEAHLQLQASVFAELPRAKFLGEELIALKKAAAANVDFTVIDVHLKIFFGILKSEKQVERELGMGLEDLLAAEERGRWWVVGSAFRLPGEDVDAPSTSAPSKIRSKQFAADLIELARKAKMNTQVRRDIFCTIASASNEDQAFEQLLKLSLKGQQERELITVIIHMMLKEKQYNAYYATLVARFCEFDRKFKMTTQFAIWDRLREAATLKPKNRAHLASFLHQILSNDVLPITVLKVVEWGLLTSAISSVLRRLFTLLGSSPQNKLRRIFEPILNPDKNPNLTEGLKVFLEVNFGGHEAYREVDSWFSGV